MAEVVLAAPGTPDTDVIRGVATGMAAVMTGNTTAQTGEYIGIL